MRLSPLLPIVVGVAALVAGGVPQAAAAPTKSYADKQRGFRVRLSDKFEQIPPKLTADESYLVGEWYADAAKFARGSGPEFRIVWFATPKAGTITPSGDGKPAAPPTAEEIEKRKREEAKPKSFNDIIDRLFAGAGARLGADLPAAKDLWKDARKSSTKTTGLDAYWLEVNDPDDKKSKPNAATKASQYYAFLARILLDRPGETIEVGFLGLAPLTFVSDGKKAFLDVVRSFEDLAKLATDSRNTGAQTELDENDPESFRRLVKRSKLVAGWTAYDTPHYIVVYPEKEVDPALAKAIGDQIEALRAQVYEVMFPSDKPITALSVIRCCKDQQQYFAYGGPPGSAGYWYPPGKELVFYEMAKSRRSDALRVLYHEGFHQYIYYSVGDFSPHSWFNEGDGDYFFGFNYDGTKWTRGTNSWRKERAKRAKKEHKFPSLWDWLHWSQPFYYGQNKSGVSIGDNYALGWDFVWFLRTTKKKEYQGILDRYFVTLKGFVTRARAAKEARVAAEKARREKEGKPPAPEDPKPPEGGDAPPPPPPPDEPEAPLPPVPPPEDPDAPGVPVPPVAPGDPAPPPAEPPKPDDPATPPAPAPEKPPEPAKPAAPPKSEGPAKVVDPDHDPEHPELWDRQYWLDKTLEEAFKGVDLKQLEKDWLEN